MKYFFILVVCLALMSTSLTYAHTATDLEQSLRQTLQGAGLLVPIKNISPSGIEGLLLVALDGQQEPLLITTTADYVIQGNIETNPSPAQPISQHLLSAHQAAGTPVSPAYKKALLANMASLKNMTADSAFYHTNIASILWGVSGQGGAPFLVSRDGRKFINGEISGIEHGQFTGLDSKFERAKNRHVFGTLNQDTLTTYPAKQSKATIYVVSDIHCPYCKIFHRHIPAFNAQGINVHIIAYPIYEESAEPMRQIWCQTNNQKRASLLNAAMQGVMPNQQCQNKQNFMLDNQKRAQSLAFVATPAIYRDDGELFEGDFSSDEFLQFLGLN